MLDNLMQVLDEQHSGDKKWTAVTAPSSASNRRGSGTNMDGAVSRDEFDTVQPRYDDEFSPMDRERVEKRVFQLTPQNHRFVAADGSKGIVYFDSRGRAADALLSQMDMGELVRLLDVYGDKQTARSPMPSGVSKSSDAGYKAPVEESLTDQGEQVASGYTPSASTYDDLIDWLNTQETLACPCGCDGACGCADPGDKYESVARTRHKRSLAKLIEEFGNIQFSADRATGVGVDEKTLHVLANGGALERVGDQFKLARYYAQAVEEHLIDVEGWGSLEERTGIPLDRQGKEIKKQLDKRNIVARVDPEMGTDRIVGYKVHVSNDAQAKTVMKLFGGKHRKRLGFVSVPKED